MVQSQFKTKTKQKIHCHLCIMLYDNSSVPPGSFSFMIFKVAMNSQSSVNTIHENSESPQHLYSGKEIGYFMFLPQFKILTLLIPHTAQFSVHISALITPAALFELFP